MISGATCLTMLAFVESRPRALSFRFEMTLDFSLALVGYKCIENFTVVPSIGLGLVNVS